MKLSTFKREPPAFEKFIKIQRSKEDSREVLRLKQGFSSGRDRKRVSDVVLFYDGLMAETP